VRTGQTGAYRLNLPLSDPGTWVVLARWSGDANHEPSAAPCVVVVKPLPPPIPSFTDHPTAPSAGAPVTFDGSGSTDPNGAIVSNH
jgi:hypothetical protein